MKAHMFLPTLILCFLGCAPQQQTDQLTQQQNDQIKTEVKTHCDSLWAKWQRLDGAATLEYMSDSPDFVALNVEGSRMDYQAFKKMISDMVGTAAGLKLTPVRENVYVMSKDAAIYAVQGKWEVSMKSGEQVFYDPYSGTLVFKKTAGQWKVVYIHESATFTVKKAEKK
jgi:ketosteroid isomerase-like protein